MALVDPSALRLARENAGLTQHQLARLVGVAGGERISRWELGASEPRPDLLVRLARALRTPPMVLLDIDPGSPDLRALRYAAGLSADQVAERVHVTKDTYLRWEAGRWARPLAARNIDSLAQALGAGTAAVRAALERTQQRP